MPHQHQFSSIFQLMPTLSVILLPDAPKFTILAINNAYLETVNSTEKDLIGKGIFEAFPGNPEDTVSKGVENLKNSLNFVIAKKDSHKMPLQKHEIPIRGTTKFKAMYVNIQNIPIKDDNNNITHILHSIEDVTDKKNLEISLDIERQRFDDLYFQAPSSMAILKGPNHVYELANPFYLELIGVKDVIGKTVKEVLPEFEAQGILEILDTVYQTGETFSANEMLVNFDHHGNGELIDTYLNYICQANRNNDGTIDGILVFASDVTELVLARKKTEESEKRYKELIENLPIATYFCDQEGNIKLYNKAAVNLWGRKPEIGKDKWSGCWKIYSENGEPFPVDLHPMAIALKEGRKISNREIIVERPNGDKLNVLPHPVLFKNSRGQVTGVVNMLIDITESKKEQEKIRFQSDLLNIITQAVITTDANGIINFWNNAAAENYGWTAEEALGKNVISLISTERKEEDTMEIIEELTKGNFSNEFVVKHKDGHTFSVSASLSPIYDKQRKFEGTIEVSRDITERKKAEQKLIQSEKRLKEAQAIAHLGSWELNFETGIGLWSKEACKIFGLSPKDNKQTYSSWLSFIHPEDKGAVLKLIDESNKTLSDLIVTYRIILKDGTIKFIYGITMFEFDDNQKPIGVYGISLDITARKKEEEKLRKLNKELAYQIGEKEIRAAELSRSNKELVKTNKELDRFVYSVSHDLRSPLTSILGLISFIEEDSREPDTLEQVKMIRSSITRLDGFIRNILSYSQNNRTGLETQKIPIKKTIHEIVKSVHNIKGASGISFQIDIDEQHPFYSDWYRFNTVLENLVSNAIKYHTKEVSGRYLKLTGTSDKEELKLSISDNGIGIDPEFHDKIFEMFYRLPGNNDGSGVGLYIVKETLKKMKGTIEIQSEKGIGTTFIITFKNFKE